MILNIFPRVQQWAVWLLLRMCFNDSRLVYFNCSNWCIEKTQKLISLELVLSSHERGKEIWDFPWWHAYRLEWPLPRVCSGAPRASPHPSFLPLVSAEAGAPGQFLVPGASPGSSYKPNSHTKDGAHVPWFLSLLRFWVHFELTNSITNRKDINTNPSSLEGCLRNWNFYSWVGKACLYENSEVYLSGHHFLHS